MKSRLPYLLFAVFVLVSTCRNWVLQEDNTSAESATERVVLAPSSSIDTIMDAPPDSGENSNMYLGNPSNAQASFVFKNNYLLNMRYYTLSYDADRGIANWVSWHVDSERLIKNTSRSNNFIEYTDFPADWHQVQSKSYSGSGFDRGHHCPSADRLTSEEANASTFSMVNIFPQAPNNNQRVWNNFEMYLRKRVEQGNEIYIIMGSYGAGGVGLQGYATTIDQGRVTVPANIWKIAVILPEGNDDLARIAAGEAEIIAINTPNDNAASSSWKKYVVSVQSIEQATGYHLLSELQTEMELQDAA